MSYFLQRSRVDQLINQWASENGYQLQSYSHVWFSLDPFVMFSGKNRHIYNLEVKDHQGNLRKGFIRVGGYWLGLWSDSCEVKWLD